MPPRQTHSRGLPQRRLSSSNVIRPKYRLKHRAESGARSGWQQFAQPVWPAFPPCPAVVWCSTVNRQSCPGFRPAQPSRFGLIPTQPLAFTRAVVSKFHRPISSVPACTSLISSIPSEQIRTDFVHCGMPGVTDLPKNVQE